MTSKIPDDDGELSGSRKIQKIGGSSYYIILPKQWVTKRGVDVQESEQKELDYVVLNDGKLLLVPETVSKRAVDVNINVDLQKSEPETILRKVISAYLWGYNKICLSSESRLPDDLRDRIRRHMVERRNLGVTAIDSSEREMMLKVETDYDSKPILACLEQMATQASFIYNQAIRILNGLEKPPTDPEHMRRLDEVVDGLYLYAVRAIKACSEDERLMIRMRLNSGRGCLGARLVARYIERIADHSREMGDTLRELHYANEAIPSMIKPQFVAFGISAQNSFSRVVHAFFNSSYDEADDEINRIDKAFLVDEKGNRGIKEAQKSLNQEIKKDEEIKASIGCELASIVRSMMRIAQNSKGIAQIVLNLNFDRTLPRKSEHDK